MLIDMGSSNSKKTTVVDRAACQAKLSKDRLIAYVNHPTMSNTVFNEHFGKLNQSGGQTNEQAHIASMQKNLDAFDVTMESKK
jgi:hypothetical protein